MERNSGDGLATFKRSARGTDEPPSSSPARRPATGRAALKSSQSVRANSDKQMAVLVQSMLNKLDVFESKQSTAISDRGA